MTSRIVSIAWLAWILGAVGCKGDSVGNDAGLDASGHPMDGSTDAAALNDGSQPNDGGSPTEPPGLVGITAAHNQVRANVSPAASPPLVPLTWSSTVATAAQTWANGCSFAHSGNGYGENIFAS